MTHHRHRNLARAAAALVVAGALAACASTSLELPPPLAGTTWQLERLDGKRPPDRVRTEIRFDADGNATGTLACNRFTTRYVQDGAFLKFDEVASTRMACPAAAMEHEERVAAVLAATRRLRRDGRTLYLLDVNGNERARLELRR